MRSILGEAGEVCGSIIENALDELDSTEYVFSEHSSFEKLPPQERRQQYWIEILYRAHWAAASNLLRHKRWADACLLMYRPKPNYLAFAAALRGLTESAADAAHSLRAASLTLADNSGEIRKAIHGQSTRDVISTELENSLIHFQFGRRLEKDEVAPQEHKACSSRTYLTSIELPGGTQVASLYAALCQVVHPAAQSLMWLSPHSSGRVTLIRGEDKREIEQLCDEHQDAIEFAQLQSVNSSLLVLRVLNSFRVSGIRTGSVDRIDLSRLPAWAKISQALQDDPARLGND